MTKIQQLKSIQENLSKPETTESMSQWHFSYNKRADMIVMQGPVPADSYYTYIGNDGAMVRTDNNGNVYGFAIENAKNYKKTHPEIGLYLSFVMRPLTTKYITIPLLSFIYQVRTNIDTVMTGPVIADYVTKSQYVRT